MGILPPTIRPVEAPPVSSVSARAQAPAYRTAFLDWLACAVRGAREAAARAARAAGDGLLERVTWAGTAGHVLDFDDTYSPGLVHASAPVAPVALVLGAERDRAVGAVLEAYAAGFEATAALARAGHTALYERGWHPTAVCGSAGAAIAAARLLDLPQEQAEAAVGLALLRAGGLRAGFGSHGKALGVGLAAAAGLHAALLAREGARAPLREIRAGAAGFERVFGISWPPALEGGAIADNWIKAYPCCLATHGAIEAALAVREHGPPHERAVVHVHPVARAAATRDDPADGLEAKFSLPYLVAFALLHGAPAVDDFDRLDGDARKLARSIEVVAAPDLAEMAARLDTPRASAAVEQPLGSPARPMDEAALRRKVLELAGTRFDGMLDDGVPAARVMAAAGF
jgi:2-methylcitrate dehydratase PrpD